MPKELYLEPVYSGTAYSPGRRDWQFFPEDYLFAGLTGTADPRTYARSALWFSLPELPRNALILRAVLRVWIARNEPLEASKHVCLRPAPADPRYPWSEKDEVEMEILSEHHLSTEIGLSLDFELTTLAEGWYAGIPNNGVILGLATFTPGLVAFPRTVAVGLGPRLALTYALVASADRLRRLSVGPDAHRISAPVAHGEIAVKNLGPGLAWITPLYDLEGKGEPLDPAGIPEGVLSSGDYLIVKPRLPAGRMSVRVATALSETVVLIAPLAEIEKEDATR